MKKVAIALVVLLVLSMGLLVGMTSYGFRFFGRAFGDVDKAEVERLAKLFLTDLQYKDFQKAAQYHTLLEQQGADIPKLIERLFQVKPEFLNIRDFDIVEVTMDPDGKRARTFFKATLELLNTAQGENPNKEKKVEGILYWHKRPEREATTTDTSKAPATTTATTTGDPSAAQLAEKWFMKLESSLR